MKRRPFAIVGVAAGAALLISGCSAGAPGAGDDGPVVGSTWEEIEQLAEEEGTLTLSVMSIPGFAAWAEYAKEQLPEIGIEITTVAPDTFVPRVVTEQDNGSYLWDVMVGPLTNVYAGLHPDYLEPIDDILDDLPAELTADEKWAGGFDHFSDPDLHTSFISEYLLGTAIAVNRAVISPTELGSPTDLLDPRWRGEICINDPRLPNQASLGLTWFLESEDYGEEFVTELLTEQDLVVLDSITTTSEWFATGRCAIAIGADPRAINELRDSGVDIEYEVLDGYGNYLLGWGASVLKNAPHPNAARVFLAWFLSEDGQKSYVDMVRADATTRLLGVEPGPAGPPRVDFDNFDDYQVRAGTSEGAAAVRRMTQLAERLLS